MNAKEFGSQELANFFSTGKMDNDFEVHDKYVTGICVMYPTRANQENEYMIREKSIVVIGDSNLSLCVQEAKDMAYQSAISRLSGIRFIPENVASTPVPPSNSSMPPVISPAIGQQESVIPKSAAPKTPPAPPVQTAPPATIMPEPDDANIDDPDDAENAELESLLDDDPAKPDVKETVTKFDLGNSLDLGLQPASNLLANAPQTAPSAENSQFDADMQKALDTEISILGKLHVCNGWKAGRILEENPQIIADFAHRYTGPKTDEKDALLKLYPEALRRVQTAA